MPDRETRRATQRQIQGVEQQIKDWTDKYEEVERQILYLKEQQSSIQDNIVLARNTKRLLNQVLNDFQP